MSLRDLMVLVGKMMVLAGFGLDSAEMKAFEKFVALLEKDAAKFDFKEAKKDSERERRFGKEDIVEIYRLREKGFSWAKIGEMKNCSGMMIGNILGNKIYKDLIAEAVKEGKIK